MSPARLAYLALVIWGTVHPMYWFVTYMQETGTGLAGLIAAWSVNASTRGLTWDLTIAAIALTVWIMAETISRRAWVLSVAARLMQMTRTLRQTVLIVAALNLAYFGVEFAAAIRIGSVSLFADSVDFLEDTCVNLLIFFAIGWTIVQRARVGMVLAGLMAIPALAFLWTLAKKFLASVPPEASVLTLIGLGALAVNLTAAFLLARHRAEQGSLTRAAFLSARNDAFANVAIIGAGLLTAAHPSIWPDIIVGLAIAGMNLDAAHEVWEAARKESKDPEA